MQLRLPLWSKMSHRQHQDRWAQQAQPPSPHTMEIILTPGPMLTDATEMLRQRKNSSENKQGHKETGLLFPLSWKLGQKGTGLQEHLETSLR